MALPEQDKDAQVNKEQYQDIKLSQNDMARTLVAMNSRLIDMDTRMRRFETALYGNGVAGLRTEVEVIKATMGLRDEHIAEVSNLKVGSLSQRTIDWKWLVNVLVSGGTLAAIVRLLLAS